MERPIDEYLSRTPDEQRLALEAVRRTVAEAAPDATEGISHGMPAFRYRGRPLVAFAAFQKYCSFFPRGHTVLDQLGDDVAALRPAKGTLHFTPHKPVPNRIFKKIEKARVEQIDAQT